MRIDNLFMWCPTVIESNELHWRNRQAAAPRQRTAATDAKVLHGVNPCVIEQPEQSPLLHIRAEVVPHFLNERDLIGFMERAGLVSVPKSPFCDPAGLSVGAARGATFCQNVFCNTALPTRGGCSLSRTIGPGIYMNRIGIHKFVQAIGSHKLYCGVDAHHVRLGSRFSRGRKGAFGAS